MTTLQDTTTYQQCSSKQLVSQLTLVINNYIKANSFPDAWKTARTSPIQKI